MLKNYESSCLEKGNFFQAQASKIRIIQLKEQQLKVEHEQLKQKNKQNTEQLTRKNQYQIIKFHEVWEIKIKQYLEEYKLIQQRLKQDHNKQIQLLQQRIEKQQPAKIKYSSTVLKLKNHLQNLIKCKMYIDAEHTKQQLQSLEHQEHQNWILKFEQKKKKQFDTVLRKQQIQMKALKIKIKSMFNEKMKEKSDCFNKLMNRIQKRKVESSKCPVELKKKEKEVRRGAESRSSSFNRTVLGQSRNRAFSVLRE